MLAEYRGFDVCATRTGDVVHYWAFKQSCGWELTSGFSYDSDTEATHVALLKGRVDDYHENPDAYEHDCPKKPESRRTNEDPGGGR